MTDEDEIFKGVCDCLLETLDKDSIEVRKEDRLINDLGIDSLDLIHLVFTLEQHFGIKISLREIDRRIKGKLGAIPLEVDGTYTPEAIAELRKSMPEIPHDELKDGLTTSQLPRCFRVATMINLVRKFKDEQKNG